MYGSTFSSVHFICVYYYSFSAMQAQIIWIQHTICQVGLAINTGKTKKMLINYNNTQMLSAQSQIFNELDSFCYLINILD